MNRNIFGWDLPPGCSTSDIPGNRPEDEAWEVILNGFWDKKDRGEDKKKALEDAPQIYVDLIGEAVEYGIDIGLKQVKDIEEENKFYEGWAEERLADELIQLAKKRDAAELNLKRTILELVVKYGRGQRNGK